MSVTVVPAIETDHMSGEKAPHYCGDRHVGGSQQQVKVIRYQCPCKTGCFGFGKDAAKPLNKVIPVNIILENLSAFDAAANYVVQGPNRVYSCFPRHNVSL
jgi:hypothetical protein